MGFFRNTGWTLRQKIMAIIGTLGIAIGTTGLALGLKIRPPHGFMVMSEQERLRHEADKYYKNASEQEKIKWKALVESKTITEAEIRATIENLIEAKGLVEHLAKQTKYVENPLWKEDAKKHDQAPDDVRRRVNEFIRRAEETLSGVDTRIFDTRWIISQLEELKKDYEKYLK